MEGGKAIKQDRCGQEKRPSIRLPGGSIRAPAAVRIRARRCVGPHANAEPGRLRCGWFLRKQHLRHVVCGVRLIERPDLSVRVHVDPTNCRRRRTEDIPVPASSRWWPHALALRVAGCPETCHRDTGGNTPRWLSGLHGQWLSPRPCSRSSSLAAASFGAGCCCVGLPWSQVIRHCHCQLHKLVFGLLINSKDPVVFNVDVW